MGYFDKIIGYEEIKNELLRISDMLNNREKYEKLGVVPSSGLLLEGRPGVGKSTMAKCLIDSCPNRKVFTIRKNQPDGQFVEYIKNSFDNAQENAPSIVFLDDLDKFSNEDDCHPNSEEFVTIQSCIDECKGKEVFVIATINDDNCIPESLLRAGRIDNTIKVGVPNLKNSIEIVKYYLNNKKNIGNIDAEEIAKILEGSTCAELESVINEAGIYAGYQGKDKIEMEDVIKACLKVIFNSPETTSYEPDVAELLAYHEAGHALISEYFVPNSVNLITINNHLSPIGGVTSSNNIDNYWFYLENMENKVRVLLGGKAATEIKFGDIDVGVMSDMRRASNLVRRFVEDYGSCGILNMDINDRENSNNYTFTKEILIRSELNRYYNETKKILIKNRDKLDKLAKALIEKKVLINTEIRNILG